MRLIIVFLISINILIASETNTVKTSELELFLFKVGFESLLKDVDITKNKSNLNEKELIKLNSKVEIIMKELYKDKRVLTNENNLLNVTESNLEKEVTTLKIEVASIKEQINKLLNKKEGKENSLLKVKTINSNEYRIIAPRANVRSQASNTAEIIEVLDKGTLLNISSCNNYGWCKFKNEEKYIAIFLIQK